MARISFDIPDKLDDAYKKLAYLNMQSKASEMRRALVEYMDKNRKE